MDEIDSVSMETHTMLCQDALIGCVKDKEMSKQSSYNYDLFRKNVCLEEFCYGYCDADGQEKEVSFDLKDFDEDPFVLEDFQIEGKDDWTSISIDNISNSPISKNTHTSEKECQILSKNHNDYWSENSIQNTVDDCDLWELFGNVDDVGNFSSIVGDFDNNLDMIEPTVEKLDSTIVDKYSYIFGQTEIDSREEDVFSTQTFFEMQDFDPGEMLTKCDVLDDLDNLWEDSFIDFEDLLQTNSSFSDKSTHCTSSNPLPMPSNPVSFISDPPVAISDSLLTSSVPVLNCMFTSSDSVFTSSVPVFTSPDPVFELPKCVLTPPNSVFTSSDPVVTLHNCVDSVIPSAIPVFTSSDSVFNSPVYVLTSSDSLFTPCVSGFTSSDPVPVFKPSHPFLTSSFPVITASDALFTEPLVTATVSMFKATVPLVTAPKHLPITSQSNYSNQATLKSVYIFNDNCNNLEMVIKQNKMSNTPSESSIKTASINVQHNQVQLESDNSTRLDTTDLQSSHSVNQFPVSSSMKLRQYLERFTTNKQRKRFCIQDKDLKTISVNIPRNNLDHCHVLNLDPEESNKCQCPRIKVGVENNFVSVRLRDIMSKNIKEVSECFKEKEHKSEKELTEEWKKVYKLLRERKLKRLSSEKEKT